MLCTHHVDIFNHFYFEFMFCNEVRWDNEAYTGVLEPWLPCGPFTAASPLLRRGSRLLLLLTPLPPFAFDGAWAQGRAEADQQVVHVLSVKDRGGPGHL